MIFSGIKGITIPEGVVQQIADGAGSILWKGGVDVSAMAISYTGAYTDQLDVVMSGKTYRLLTLTGSGTLTLEGDVTADVWMCSGGNGGGGDGSSGGGGGLILQSNGIQIGSTTVCTLGAGATGASSSSTKCVNGNPSTFGDMTSPAQTGDGWNGESGGGEGAGAGYKGTGTGETTVPFGESAVFDQHCAGGGGGGSQDASDSTKYGGGDGGSNGSSGGGTKKNFITGGAGGTKGGGAGGEGNRSKPGSAATFYGSGGGGGGTYWSKAGSHYRSAGGAGYQGVIYVRIPYEQ